MQVDIESSWARVLADEFEKPYFKELAEFVRNEYLSGAVYPPPKFVFNAFSLTPFDQVRVVILGQDPYINRGEAHGLCFSVPEGVRVPPSLKNIYKEIVDDLGLEVEPRSADGNLNPQSFSADVKGQTFNNDEGGNLERWATQGVLLLNATLTVRAGASGSHQNKGWETFTDAVIKTISDKKEHVVFLLWGRYAQKKGEGLIDETKHLVLRAAHPSPLAGGKFFGCKHFSQTNAYLERHEKKPIQWI